MPTGEAAALAASSLVRSKEQGPPLETLVLVIALLIGGYVLSLFLHPWTTCTRCRGKPRSQGAVFSYSHRVCSKCKGTGQQPRLGTKLLGIGPGKPS